MNKYTKDANRGNDRHAAKGQAATTFNCVLPTHWKQAKIGEVCDFSKRTLVPQNFPDEVFEYYSIPAFQEHHAPVQEMGRAILSNKMVVQDRTVLFGKLNPRVLKVWLVESQSPHRKIASTEFLPIVPNGLAESKFLYYMCHSDTFVSEAQRLVSGSTPSRQRIDPTAFYEIEIPLPPLDEQRAITLALDTLQKSIEVRQRELFLEHGRKDALLERLFVHGIHGEPSKQTLIGDVPADWMVVELGNLITSGPQNGVYKPMDLYGKGAPIIRIDDFDNEGRVFSLNLRRVSLSPDELALYELAEGDILLNRVNSLSHLGKTMLVPRTTEPTVFESNMMRFKVDELRVLAEFVARYLVTESCKNYIRSRAKRAVGQSSVNQGDVRSIRIPIPPLTEQTEIVSLLEAADHKVGALERETTCLKELFQGMLERLVTGQLSVLPLLECATCHE